MKKGLGILCFLLLFMSTVKADIRKEEEVILNRCVDGDTAVFIANGEELKVRFLAIDAPEYTTKKEAYGKEASEYVCGKLKGADRIVLQYDDNAGTDKYGRTLAWIFVDGSLLQEELISKGLANVAYLKANYEYTEQLQIAEKRAQEKKLNIWSNTQIEPEAKYDWKIIISSGIIIVLAFLFVKKKSDKKRIVKKHLNKIKRSIK